MMEIPVELYANLVAFFRESVSTHERYIEWHEGTIGPYTDESRGNQLNYLLCELENMGWHPMSELGLSENETICTEIKMHRDGDITYPVFRRID